MWKIFVAVAAIYGFALLTGRLEISVAASEGCAASQRASIECNARPVNESLARALTSLRIVTRQ
jgi:hypothetical protein